MTEATLEAPTRIGPNESDKQEKTPLRRKVVRQLKRAWQYVKPKRAGDTKNPAGYTSAEDLQNIAEKRRLEAEKQKEHNKRRGEQGCLLRSFITAAVRASDAKNLDVKNHDLHGGFEALQKIIPTDKEYAMRFAQVDKGKKAVEKLNEDIENLFEEYKNAQPPTDLSRALRNLKISVNAPESIETIKNRIREGKKTGEQILVYRRDPKDLNKAHILHAVLNRDDQLISLSDPIKEGKKTHYPSEEENLSQGMFWTFSITSTEAIPSNTQNTEPSSPT